MSQWLLTLLWLAPAWCQTPDSEQPSTSATVHPKPSVFSPAYWFNPATAPFLPVPEVATDPDSGTTYGLLMVKLKTDELGDIRRIIAPDILYNLYFGYGEHVRVYNYPSEDEQWSVVGGIKERVERAADLEYQTGRLRTDRWTFTGSLVYDRDGTPRFFGIGNNSPAIDETDYTEQQAYLQTQLGFNLDHTWQVLYTLRARSVDVLPGTLAGIGSIQSGFARVLGIGANSEFLNRISIVYDTRDNLTVPSYLFSQALS